jgi:hypothetical protein
MSLIRPLSMSLASVFFLWTATPALAATGGRGSPGPALGQSTGAQGSAQHVKAAQHVKKGKRHAEPGKQRSQHGQKPSSTQIQ